jgi:hypothetical protein
MMRVELGRVVPEVLKNEVKRISREVGTQDGRKVGYKLTGPINPSSSITFRSTVYSGFK